MKKIKKINNENIVLSNEDYLKYDFIQTKAIAILKLTEYLSKETKMVIDPFDIIKQEFVMKYDKEKLNDTVLYKIVISCLIDTTKYLENKLQLNYKELYKYFN